MKNKGYTVFVLLVMLLIGGAYWIDCSLFTNPETGFVEKGGLWVRYVVLAVPLLLAVLGVRRVKPYAMAVLRVKSRPMGVLFAAAGIAGFAHGVAGTAFGIPDFLVTLNMGADVEQAQKNALLLAAGYLLIQGLLFVWYGIWMLLVSRQMLRQDKPSPTAGAFPGVLAALPFCLQTIYRVMINPSSVYRLSNVVHALVALFSMLWLALLLRALYIALVRQRVRWMYLFGLVTFLFSVLEVVQTVHRLLQNGFDLAALLEAVCVGLLGLLTGSVSVIIAGMDTTPDAALEPPKQEKKIYRRTQF